MSERKDLVEYWERSVPWTFRGEDVPYTERRRLRYELQDYMLTEFRFDGYSNMSVLELGSGGGIDSAEFGRHGARIVSLDFTKRGTETTAALLREAEVIPRPVRADLLHIPFKDSSFDCVYSFGVIHHVPNATGAVEEIARVLADGGDLMLMLYNKGSLLYAYSILYSHRSEGFSDQELLNNYSERISGSPHSQVYDAKTVTDLLAPYFESLVIHPRFTVLDLPGARKFKTNIPDEYGLGWHLIVHARRKARE